MPNFIFLKNSLSFNDRAYITLTKDYRWSGKKNSYFVHIVDNETAIRKCNSCTIYGHKHHHQSEIHQYLGTKQNVNEALYC